MSRNSSGTYTLPDGNPVVSGTTIEADWANDTLGDVAAALTDSISKSGVTTPTANLPMGGYRHTGVGNATARNQYLSMGQAQDWSHCQLTAVSGSNNITGNMPGWASGTPTTYPNGCVVAWVQPITNTGGVTISVSGLAAKSVRTQAGDPLIAGDLVANKYYMAYYSTNDNKFYMLTDATSTAANGAQQAANSGWRRPADNIYPDCTISSATEVDIPAGNGYINTIGANSAVTTTYVTWDAQTVALDYVATDYSSHLMIDSNGTVVQYATTVPNNAWRENIYLCQAVHPNGTILAIMNTPAIYADDGGLLRDLTIAFGNVLVSGGKITENGGTALHLDVSAGVIFSPGSARNDANSPNLFSFGAVTDLEFYTMSGADYVSGSTVQLSPITYYNPGGANAAAVAIPAGTDAVIHRLFFQGLFIYWVFGQTLYSSFADALDHLEVDRSEFQMPAKLSGATLIAEIIATKNATDYTDPTKTAIISASGRQYLFGSAQSIADAPNNANTYGRQGGNWVTVIGSTSPTITTDATITGTAPRLKLDYSGAETDYSGYDVISTTGFRQFSSEISIVDDAHYIRSRDPADGSVRYTTTYNLATGAWTFPGPVTTGAATVTNLTASGTVNFTGTGAAQLPSGTTAQRPTPTNGMIRYNSSLPGFEGYANGAWGSIGGGATSDMFYENAQTISTDVTLSAARNSMSAGPITIADGVTVTIPSGANWSIV